MARRKDTKNRVLLTGETFVIKNGKEMYCFRWKGYDGKRHAIYSRDLKELRIREKNVQMDKLEGLRHAGTLTINDFYYKWAALKKGIKENTFANYKYMYESFVKDDFGKRRLADIKKSDVRCFYVKLHDRQGLKVRTIDGIHIVLYQVLELALEDGYLRNNPAHNAMTELKKINEDSGKRVALTVEEQKMFESCLDKEENKWLKPVFMTMLIAGLRVGEATGLRWSDINFEESTIDVNHTLVYFKPHDKNFNCKFIISTPKTKNSIRKIVMTDKLKKILMDYKEQIDAVHLRCVSVIDGYSDFCFFNRMNRTVYNQAVLNKAIKRIRRDCNLELIDLYGNTEDLHLLPNFSCHHLRHTAATRLCESGVNTRFIMDTLGHADITTTMNIYVDVTKSFKKDEMVKFQEYMNKL